NRRKHPVAAWVLSRRRAVLFRRPGAWHCGGPGRGGAPAGGPVHDRHRGRKTAANTQRSTEKPVISRLFRVDIRLAGAQDSRCTGEKSVQKTPHADSSRRITGG